MFRPGTVNEADYSPQDEPAQKQKIQPFGNIQKISQEGSKNTYVIILSKDCIKGESHKGPPIIKCPPVGNHSRALPRRPITGEIQDDEFDSPTCGDEDGPSKVSYPTEDVKLNLSNINDEDYDSNASATNVFLKPEFIQAGITHDSAIEADLSQASDHQDSLINHSTSYFCEKSKMNTYVIPSPLTVQQDKKPGVGQHAFPMISPQFAGSKNSLLYNTPMHFEKQSNSSTARKIFLVTPEEENGGILKKSVAYTNEAVPTMGKSRVNEFSGSVSLLKRTNPKAVPTFNNISPINQTHVPSTSFMPINPSASPAFGVQLTHGPFTSTPMMGDANPRLQQLKHESSSHRPVYVIQSPFSRQISTEPTGFTGNKTATEFDSSVTTSSVSTLLNNSSGFISGSSSLELFEASSSVDSPRMQKEHSDGVYSSTEISYSKKTHSTKEIGGRKSPSEVGQSKQGFSTKLYEVNDGSGGIVVEIENEDSNDVGIGLESETEQSVTSSQESEYSDIVDIATLNKSLTNMQWLKGMQLKDEKTSSHCQQNPVIPWKSLSYAEIKQIGEEYGRDRRPNFSYMIMIQMALYSRDDRKMMLKEICKWIEDTFPYYKYTAKPGWKNSIRHNLSLYNIFERSPAKRHGSYWTIRPDMEPKTKPYKDRNSNSESRSSTPSLPSQAPGAMIPIIPMYSSMGQLSAIQPGSVYMQPPTTATSATCRKKGPPPILPRPSPYGTPQAYALIPINGVGQQFGSTSTAQAQQPMIVNFSNSSGQVSACPSPGITEMSAAVASIQMSSASPIPMEHGTGVTDQKYSKGPPMSIVKQAWLDCQSVDTASSVDSDIVTSNDLTSSNDMASSSEFTKSRGKSKRPRILNPGLPKPTIYVDKDQETKLIGSKRRKLQQKERPLLNDSSDEEEDEGEKFISNLVKDLTVPMESQNTELEDPLTTSTPMKNASSSSDTHLPSPISGFTPLRNSGLFDGSFLDSLTERKNLGLSLTPGSKKDMPSFNDSPNASILDFVTIPTFNSPDKFGEGSPDANNPNLSKFLTECGLDPNFVENTENFPHLNWSSIQQIVDSMDTTE